MFLNPDEFRDGVQPLSRKELSQLGLQPMTLRDLLFALDDHPAFSTFDDGINPLTEI